MKNKKSKEKNFEVLKKIILNNVMSFNDLENLLKNNGYYGMFSCSLVQKNGRRHEVIYKAIDDCNYDLKIHLLIDANIRALGEEVKGKGKLPTFTGMEIFERVANCESTGVESIKVLVTDFQKVLDFNEKVDEVYNDKNIELVYSNNGLTYTETDRKDEYIIEFFKRS